MYEDGLLILFSPILNRYYTYMLLKCRKKLPPNYIPYI